MDRFEDYEAMSVSENIVPIVLTYTEHPNRTRVAPLGGSFIQDCGSVSEQLRLDDRLANRAVEDWIKNTRWRSAA